MKSVQCVFDAASSRGEKPLVGAAIHHHQISAYNGCAVMAQLPQGIDRHLRKLGGGTQGHSTRASAPEVVWCLGSA